MSFIGVTVFEHNLVCSVLIIPTDIILLWLLSLNSKSLIFSPCQGDGDNQILGCCQSWSRSYNEIIICISSVGTRFR